MNNVNPQLVAIIGFCLLIVGLLAAFLYAISTHKQGEGKFVKTRKARPQRRHRRK